MVLFSAMVGAGLLTRAMSQTIFTQQIQSAALGTLNTHPVLQTVCVGSQAGHPSRGRGAGR